MKIRDVICFVMTGGKHEWEAYKNVYEECRWCGKTRTLTPTPEPQPTPEPDSEESSAALPDKQPPSITSPHWDLSRATPAKLNHWNPATSRNVAKILLPASLRNKTCWATLQDANGARETMNHANPTDDGNRPRYYARRLGVAYASPVQVIVQTTDGDLVYTVNNAAKKGGN